MEIGIVFFVALALLPVVIKLLGSLTDKVLEERHSRTKGGQLPA